MKTCGKWLFLMMITLMVVSGSGKITDKNPQTIKSNPLAIEYSMEYLFDRTKDGLAFATFGNISGFWAVCIEIVSDLGDKAQVFSKMSVSPGPEADPEKKSSISMALDPIYFSYPYVYFRFRNGEDGPIVYYFRYTPNFVPCKGTLSLGKAGRIDSESGKATIFSAGKCPTWCFLAKIDQTVPEVCSNSKCCNDGTVMYGNSCAITCLTGDCEEISSSRNLLFRVIRPGTGIPHDFRSFLRGQG